MKKTFIKLISSFLVVTTTLTSCVASKDSTVNTTKPTDNFNVKSLPETSEKTFNVFMKDKPAPVVIKTTRAYLKNTPITLGDDVATPSNLTKIVNPPLSYSDLVVQKNREIQEYREWLDRLNKIFSNLLQEKHSNENEKARKDFEEKKKLLLEGSIEFKNLIQVYEDEKKGLNSKQIGEKHRLEDAFKLQWDEILKLINTKYLNSEKKTFSTKFSQEDIENALRKCYEINILVGLGCTLLAVAAGVLIAIFGGAVVSAVTGKNPPPSTINQPVNQDGSTTSSVDSSTGSSSTSPIQTQLQKDTDTINAVVDFVAKFQNFIQVNQKSGGASLLIPFRFSDIVNNLGIGVELNSSKYSDCSNIPLKGQEAVNFLEDIKIGKKKCDFALGNLYNSFGTKSVALDSLLKDYGINYDENKNNIVVTIDFQKASNISKTDVWMENNLRYYYADEPNIETIITKVKDVINNKRFGVKLKSPQLCKQDVNFRFESTETDDLVSFLSITNRQSLIFDGEYEAELYYTSGSKETKVKSLKVELAEDLGVSARKLSQTLNYPLKMSDISYSSTDTFDKKGLYFNVDNKTANLWDLSIKGIQEPEPEPNSPIACVPERQFNCVDQKGLLFKFNRTAFENGVYKVNSNYSADIINDIKGIDETRITNRNDYKFVISNIDYSSFSRLTTRPEEVKTFSHFIGEDTDEQTRIADFTTVYNTYYNINGLSTLETKLDVSNSIPQPTNSSSKSEKVVFDTLKDQRIIQPLFNPAKSLIIDLSSNHGVSNYDAFSGLTTNSCTDKYLHVGSVVNLTNKLTRNNNALFKKNTYLPLKLKIVDSNNNPIKTWSFDARIGSNTIIEKYWDGTGDNQQSTNNTTFVNSPNYPSLNGYKVIVELDEEKFDYNIPSGKHAQLKASFSANFAYPVITSDSKQNSFSVSDENCVFFNQEIADQLITRIDDLIIESDTIIASGNGFSIAAVGTEPPITDIDYKLLNQRIKELKDAMSSKNIAKIKQLAAEIKSIGQRILVNQTIKASVWASTTTFLMIASTSSLTFGQAAGMNIDNNRLNRENGVNEATREANRVLQKIETKDCKSYGTSTNLSNINLQIKQLASSLRDDYDLLILDYNNRNFGSFTTRSDGLQQRLIEFFPIIYNFKNQLEQDCDDCMKKYPDWDSKENLECRLKKMTKVDRDKFRETLKIRKFFNDSNFGKRTFSQIKQRTLAYGLAKEKNANKQYFIIAVSGGDEKDPNIIRYTMLNGTIIDATISKVPTIDTIFKTRKAVNSTGEPIYNDAEIKIFDYVHKAFPKSGNQKTVNLQTVFSDRLTCEYCQDVVRRIRKAEKSETNVSQKQYLDLSDGIFANFSLENVDGKPLYGGEQIDKDKYDNVIKILSTLQ